MKQILAAVGLVILIITIIAVYFTWTHVDSESKRLHGDIQYRSYLVVDSLRGSVEPNFINKSDQYLQSVVVNFADKQRLAGIAIVDNTGKYVARSSSLSTSISKSPASNQIITD